MTIGNNIGIIPVPCPSDGDLPETITETIIIEATSAILQVGPSDVSVSGGSAVDRPSSSSSLTSLAQSNLSSSIQFAAAISSSQSLSIHAITSTASFPVDSGIGLATSFADTLPTGPSSVSSSEISRSTNISLKATAIKISVPASSLWAYPVATTPLKGTVTSSRASGTAFLSTSTALATPSVATSAPYTSSTKSTSSTLLVGSIYPSRSSALTSLQSVTTSSVLAAATTILREQVAQLLQAQGLHQYLLVRQQVPFTQRALNRPHLLVWLVEIYCQVRDLHPPAGL